jgi:hypothetical protein
VAIATKSAHSAAALAAGIAVVGGLACLVLIRSRDLHQEPADGERQPVAAAVTLITMLGYPVDPVDTDFHGGYELRAQSG